VRELVFEAGVFIYRRGDTPDYAFVIVSGEMEIRWPDNMRTPTRLGQGVIFGQIGIMTDQPRWRSALALGRVAAAGIARIEFLAEFNPGLDVVEPFLRWLFATLHEVDSLLNSGAAATPPEVATPPESNAQAPPKPTWATADQEAPEWGPARGPWRWWPRSGSAPLRPSSGH